MIIRLQTRCGCVRLMERPNNWLDEVIEIALFSPVKRFEDDMHPTQMIFATRRFKFRGTDNDGVYMYLEES